MKRMLTRSKAHLASSQVKIPSRRARDHAYHGKASQLLQLQQHSGNRAVGSLLGGGRALEPAIREDLEGAVGRDLSGIRIHYGAQAARSAELMNANAFTVGRDIVFGSSTYAPHTGAGKELLAHEVIHSLQQTANSGPSPALAPDSSLERGVGHAAHDVAAGRQTALPAPTGMGIARQFRSQNVGTLDDEELQREYDLVHLRLVELQDYPEREADEDYLDLIIAEIMRRPGMAAATSAESLEATAPEHDDIDGEFWIEPPRLREGSRPIYDDESGAIVGFRYGGSYWEIYNLYGEMVESGEVGLESPLIDPIDILAGGLTGIGRGLIRGGGRAIIRGAAGGAGRGTGGAIVKAGIAVTIKNLSKRAASAIRGVYRSIRFRGTLNFTTTTARHMATAGRRVPHHILKLAVRFGKRVPDPAGVKGAYQYTVPMIRNGRTYTLEVVLREADQTVLHFLYR